MPGPLAAGEHPIERIAGNIASGVLVLCDHATNAIPPEYGNLGMPPAELARHIGYDIGAAMVARRLAARLDAPALLTDFSRLLIDPNRGLDDPTLVMRLSDGAIVPGNARIDHDEIARRVARFYRPYDIAIAAAIDASIAQGVVPVVISIHSFTPIWRGRPRPWEVAVLWDADPRLPLPLIAALRRAGDLTVGDNEPYDGALAGDVIARHATARGLANALIEVRQDLIADREGAEAWGDRLAAVIAPLLPALSAMGIAHYPSRALTREPPLRLG
ncbi:MULTISPECIES: N-formylglutamate amidohydrolase [unclassified Chelatococcus]|uniref:N-formylglutamate amidohydrolase n=1 Tax=unclassified Chelatococcus TaxID=2638111 RepID=UPI001BCB6C00|nr:MULTISPECIES: N-formylglutamate amidohydrolase [unclassified Chelatococcus]MBS7696034.1 N-formylglutamate amidohydrolase [Chelatococcus sp. YT9]MBX3558017.1 N-formylglutamate amidohydrolase [Chelatococcus sp.]